MKQLLLSLSLFLLSLPAIAWTVYYDPADGQVMYAYSGDTTSTEARKYTRAESDFKVTRDQKVVVRNGKVVSATASRNPDQPDREPAVTTDEIVMEALGITKEAWDAARQRVLDNK